jgi:uncharacterized protein
LIGYRRRTLRATFTLATGSSRVGPRRLIDKVGEDNILFETDFPHPTSLYGQEVHDRIKGGLSDCEESVRRKILWSNGEKLYKVTPPTAADEAKRAAAA